MRTPPRPFLPPLAWAPFALLALQFALPALARLADVELLRSNAYVFFSLAATGLTVLAGWIALLFARRLPRWRRALVAAVYLPVLPVSILASGF